MAALKLCDDCYNEGDVKVWAAAQIRSNLRTDLDDTTAFSNKPKQRQG